MMNEDSLEQYIAKEQNMVDHLTKEMYGSGIKFESLSAIGQYTIEAKARERLLSNDPNPELRTAKVENIDLRAENARLEKRLAAALRDNQELWEQNEEYRLREYDAEEDNSRRSTRRREVPSEKRIERDTDAEGDG